MAFIYYFCFVMGSQGEGCHNVYRMGIFHFRSSLLAVAILLGVVGFTRGGERFGETVAAAGESVAAVAEEGFSPVNMIFDHILDSHEWHIMTVGETHVSLPLPVILYSRLRGEWFCFLSNRFEHGQASYAGFRMAVPEEGGRAKIVEDCVGEAPLPVDLSITKNVAGVFVACGLLLWIFIHIGRRYTRYPDRAPHGIQNLFELIILFVRDEVVYPTIGEERGPRFLPVLLTIFFFILFNNILGLIPLFPAGANVTGNITVTMSLAIVTFLITTFVGTKSYWKGIFNTPGVPWYMKFPVPIMPVIELIGMLTKPVVLMVRLFANMLSGHMIILVFFSLIFLFGSLNVAAGYGVSVLSIIFAMFITLIDLLVSFIQAYVFTMLSAMYIGASSSREGH